MRFMMQVRADKKTEAGVLPSKELVAAMGWFNEEMVKAGVLLAADGLQPSSKGARITFSRGKRTVADGPFAETKELIAKRVPFAHGEVIEIRQVFEAPDF